MEPITMKVFTGDGAKRYLQLVTSKHGYCKPEVQL